MTAHLILIRGLPGSGKSTLAKALVGYTHLEADMYHIKNGVYCYEPSKIQAAHLWCQNETLRLLKSGESVVVAYTFVRHWEMQPYLEMRFPTAIVIAKGKFQNIHGVPDSVLERMAINWEN